MNSKWIRIVCSVLAFALIMALLAVMMPKDRGEPENPITGIIESFPPVLAGAAADETEPTDDEPPASEPPETTEPEPNPPETTMPSNDSETVPQPTSNPGNTTETVPGTGPSEGTEPHLTDETEPTPGPSDPPAPTKPQEDSDPVIMTDLSNREISFSELENDLIKFYAYIKGGSSELYLRVNLRNDLYTGNGTYLTPDGMDYSAKLTMGKNYFTIYLRDGSSVVSYVSFVISYVADKASEENPSVGDHPPSITTNLDSGITDVKNDSFRLYVSARNYKGNPIFANSIQVRLDGTVVPVANGWIDPEYELYFEAPIDSDSSEHIITVTAWDDEGNSRYISYKIVYHSVSDGDVIGTIRIILDATTLGLGWLDDPYSCEIHKNTPVSVYVLQMLDDYGYYATYSGTATSHFYLNRISRADVGRGAAVPEELWKKIQDDGINQSGRFYRDSIGEFDYTTASGWMYSVNGSLYPSDGMDSTYLHDGDTIYIRFTLAYGKDIGGSSNQGLLSTYCGTWLNGSYQENHNYDGGAVILAPTCTEQGVFAYTCQVKNCGHQKAQPVEAMGHQEEQTDYLPPTESVDGFIEFTCLRCGKVRREILPKLAEDPDPTDPDPTEPDPTDPPPEVTDPDPSDPEPSKPSDPEPEEPGEPDYSTFTPFFAVCGLAGFRLRKRE